MVKTTKATLFWAGVLALGGLSFWAGRAQAACNHWCWTVPQNNCVYSGSTGQILKLNNCKLKLWIDFAGNAGSCNGTQSCTAETCVGSDTYCRAPASGEYSWIGCGTSCSGTTSIGGCQTCS